MRNIVISAVGIVVLLLLFFFVLRSCTRSAESPSGIASDGSLSSSAFLTSCDADPATGICSPQEDIADERFDWDAFMATVRAHQKSSSSSSARAFVSGQFFTQIIGRGNSSSTVSSSSAPASSSVSSSFSFSSSRRDWFPEFRGASGGRYEESGSASSGATGSVTRASASSSAASGGGASATSGATGAFSTGTGGFVGYGGLQGTTGPLPSGRCLRSRSLLSIFGGDMTSGNFGWTFPVLIDGGCPISAAILKGPESGNGFGGPLNDF